MFRLAASAALIVLLSGCLAGAPPAPAAVDALAQDDGMTVTAIRVEPLVHAVDVTDRITARPCRLDGEQPCNGGIGPIIVGNSFGFEWEVPTRDFADPAALFWRVSLVADWQSESLVSALKMTVFATSPCGIACVRDRPIASEESAASPIFDRLDVYLEPGETGVRIQLQAVGNPETSLGEAAVDYHLYGGVAGYRAAADPVVIG